MESNETRNSTAIGLDVGTSRIVVARQAGQGFQYQAQLNAFVSIPYLKMTEAVLQKENVPHVVDGERIVVHGNESEALANFLQVETRRPMDKGFLNPQEPDNLARLSHIIGSLCGKSDENHLVYFSVPAAPNGDSDSLIYHEATLKQVLENLGYRAKSITEGLAVVYAELEDSNYTGLGISCGGGLCNVCLSYLSIPVLSFSIPKAGDFIDTSSAAVTGDRATRVRSIKEESFRFNGHFSEKMHQVISVYYDDMIRALADALRDQLSKCRGLPKLARPIPLVLSGGSALPGGFRDRFEKVLSESNLPISFSEIRLAGNPLYSTAAGALIAAMIEPRGRTSASIDYSTK
ncbi:MAG: hypothetical protein H6Q07_1849 [Acidobacteria bacterium]|nr:hypothetical protein [Acidobacteriota bacterium]